jgi:hypothetical protein
MSLTLTKATTLTIVDYDESADEFTIRFDNERPDETVEAVYLYHNWAKFTRKEPLNDVDRALAKIYDDHFEDGPHDLLNKSASL